MSKAMLELLAGEGGSIVIPGEAERLEESLGHLSDFPAIRGFTGLAEENVFLWQIGEQHHLGKLLPPHAQQTQDCVAHAWAVAAQDYLLCNHFEAWLGELSTEVLYGGSRHTIGKGRLSQPGSCCAWAAAFVVKFGNVMRAKYANHDLAAYNYQATLQFGSAGVPQELMGRLQKLRRAEDADAQVSRVRSANAAQLAIARYCPIPFACKTGFAAVRGKEGICSPKGEWNHAMVLRGVCRTLSGKLCFAVQNSAGDYLGEANRVVPLANNTEVTLPAGVFLVEADVMQPIFEKEDAYAIF